jgi:7-cyano-7-deazaguanine synthase
VLVGDKRGAVILLSGGLDSATTAAIACAKGFELYAMTVLYGQRHAIEVEAARRVARAMKVRQHLIEQIDLRVIGGSALTAEIDVPKSRSDREIVSGVPITYVPARNTILLALALAYAEVAGVSDIFIGVNAVDYSGYPDCRPAFIEAFENLANQATKAGIEGQRFSIHAPLIEMTKADIIRRGTELGVDYGLTHSCYDPTVHDLACGQCDSCQLRKRGFQEAGIPDPISYATS